MQRRITKNSMASIGCIACLALTLPGAADVLKLPGEPAEVLVRDDLPARGATQAQVRQHYGEPQAVQPAVGEPPISSWRYSDYIVYFEHDRVLHSVVRSEDRQTSAQR